MKDNPNPISLNLAKKGLFHQQMDSSFDQVLNCSVQLLAVSGCMCPHEGDQ